LRIGIVTTWFERGAAYVSKAYRDVLTSLGHDVWVFARGGEDRAKNDPNWNDERVTWSKPTWFSDATRVDPREFKQWILQNGLDLVLFNEQNYWPTVVMAKRETNAIIGSYVDYYTSDTVPFFDLYDFLLCNTKRHYSVFRNHPGAHFIPWGTDCSVFAGQAQPVSTEDIVFFHSAGMSPERKGTFPTVKAFSKVTGQRRLLIHSQAPLSQYPPDVRQQITDDDSIEFIHKTVGAPGLYHLGDIYVYPTVLEGIGLTICEALASGLPVVTTDAPPMNEFVQDGENGRLIKVKDWRARADGYYWAEACCDIGNLASLMQDYVDSYDQLTLHKEKAQAHARTHFDWLANSQSAMTSILANVSRRPMSSDMREISRRAQEYSALPLFRAGCRMIASRIGISDQGWLRRWLYD